MKIATTAINQRTAFLHMLDGENFWSCSPPFATGAHLRNNSVSLQHHGNIEDKEKAGDQIAGHAQGPEGSAKESGNNALRLFCWPPKFVLYLSNVYGFRF